MENSVLERLIVSTLDSNMQGNHTASKVVIVHMTKTALLHQGLQSLLIRMHPNGLSQIPVARLITGHPAAEPR